MKIPKITDNAKQVLLSGWPKFSRIGFEMIFKKCKENGEPIINRKAVCKAIDQLGL